MTYLDLYNFKIDIPAKMNNEQSKIYAGAVVAHRQFLIALAKVERENRLLNSKS